MSTPETLLRQYEALCGMPVDVVTAAGWRAMARALDAVRMSDGIAADDDRARKLWDRAVDCYMRARRLDQQTAQGAR